MAQSSASPVPSDSSNRPKGAQRVSFATLYQDSLIEQGVSPEDANERTRLLAANHDPEEGEGGEDEDDNGTSLKLTLRGAIVGFGVLIVVALIIVGAVLVRTSGAPRNPAYLIGPESHGVVASENEDCSQIGVDVLKDGGNAVDAIIAANLCIGTLNFFSSGIGGGGFAIVRIPDAFSNSSKVFTIDFRETAPALANATMFGTNPELSKFGGLSVGVPGELRGLAEMHRRWGKLSWKRVVEPSAKLARGWEVAPELARRLSIYGKFMVDHPDWKELAAPNGKLLKQGEHISRPAYAQTLSTIAAYGAEAFYKGPIAESMVRKIRKTGGIMTLEDLESYRPIVAQALEGSYRGSKVYTTYAPTSGPVLLHLLNILEQFDLAGEGRTSLNIHRLVEALKFGFAGRTHISDPAFLLDEAYIHLLSDKRFGSIIAANITDDTTHTAEYYHPIYDVKEDHGTTHTSVVDSDGMAVALTSTINLIFGSGVLDPQTGVIFNDELDDFSVPNTPNAFGLWPSPYNYPKPGKRPLSSTAPTIIENPDGTFSAALGGSGGSRIFGAIAQVIVNMMDWEMNVSAAIEEPRVHDQLFPAVVSIESTFSGEAIKGLKERGHNITVFDINRGVAEIQAVVARTDGYYGASDSRKNGKAAGY